MPNRLLHAGLISSERVHSLPYEGRWLFITILLTADDLGLFEATPFRLARDSGISRDQVEGLLQALADRDLVRLYQGPGMRVFGFIPRFRQRLQIRRPKHPLPPPELIRDDEEVLKKINDLRPNPTVTHGESPGSTVTHGESPPEAEAKYISKKTPSSSHPPGGGQAPPKASRSVARFPEFWQAWPKSERKQDKAKCLDHWQRNLLDEQADRILADVRVKRGTRKWQEGFIEAPLVYLRGKRWLDEVTPDTGEPGAPVKPWHETRSGIVAKGVEVGVGAWDEVAFSLGRGESFVSYTKRVMAAAGEPA